LGWAWGRWVNESDAKVERDIVRMQAHTICDGPAWIDADDDRHVLCATGSMRLLRRRNDDNLCGDDSR